MIILNSVSVVCSMCLHYTGDWSSQHSLPDKGRICSHHLNNGGVSLILHAFSRWSSFLFHPKLGDLFFNFAVFCCGLNFEMLSILQYLSFICGLILFCHIHDAIHWLTIQAQQLASWD